SLYSLILFAIIFVWTPPHFWALSLYRAGDYAKAGVPMLPVVSGVAHTKRHILGYSLVLFATALAPALLGFASLFYGVCAALLGGCFLVAALRVLRHEGDRPARQMFGFSILYLFMIFAILIVDKSLGLAG
ncbi:MAG: UbiA family prenyltransferase, partial [Proteobacteria bacterium]|nr:UbiA family prenyltransferase [Pseudomonadota bacterium]